MGGGGGKLLFSIWGGGGWKGILGQIIGFKRVDKGGGSKDSMIREGNDVKSYMHKWKGGGVKVEYTVITLKL